MLFDQVRAARRFASPSAFVEQGGTTEETRCWSPAALSGRVLDSEVWLRFFFGPPTIDNAQPQIRNNVKFEQQGQIFCSILTHELFGRLKFTIPNLQTYSPKNANFEKFGLGIDNISVHDTFLCICG